MADRKSTTRVFSSSLPAGVRIARSKLPDGLKDLKRVARAVGLKLTGAVLNLDAGFDSKANRKSIFNAGMKPNIKENPRNRKKPKRGRKRFFDEVLYQLRFAIERTFAWEDKFKRLLLLVFYQFE